jgi:hypothetical protein
VRLDLRRVGPLDDGAGLAEALLDVSLGGERGPWTFPFLASCFAAEGMSPALVFVSTFFSKTSGASGFLASAGSTTKGRVS